MPSVPSEGGRAKGPAPVIANQSADWCGNPPDIPGAKGRAPVIANQSADWCGNPQDIPKAKGERLPCTTSTS